MKPKNWKEIDKAVEKVAADYGDTLRMLGKEEGYNTCLLEIKQILNAYEKNL